MNPYVSAVKGITKFHQMKNKDVRKYLMNSQKRGEEKNRGKGGKGERGKGGKGNRGIRE